MQQTEALPAQLKRYAAEQPLHVGDIAAVTAGVEFAGTNVLEERRLAMTIEIACGNESAENKINGLRHVLGSCVEILP